MRVKFKRWAVDYLDESKENQFNLLDEDKNKLSSFINEKKTYIEIGPGKGEFILSLASKFPAYNFIVIELNKTISGICLKKIDESKLTNVKLVAGDFYLFANQIEKKSIEGVFLNFSDPWPKRKHENRRLTSDRFLLNYAYILKMGGKIIQKTDNIDLFNYSLEQYKENNWQINDVNLEYNTLDDFDAETEYEHKFKSKGNKIYRVIVENTKETRVRKKKMKYAIYYNYKTIGDVLVIIFDSNAHPDTVKKNNDVVGLYKNDKLVGINILNFSEIMKLKVDGFIPVINEKMLKIINDALVNAGFEPLEEQKESGFRVAEIIECEEHPDSEHLHVLKVNVGNNEILDIVCGAFNARVGLKCVCALPYTFMPNGQQIIPSKLLGIQSNGMLCSGRELALPGYEGKHGLLELDENSVVGSDFFKEVVE